MKEKDRQLLDQYENGRLSIPALIENFSVDFRNDSNFVRTEMHAAIATRDASEIQMTLQLIWLSPDITAFIDVLNNLLVNPDHQSHQSIAKQLQDYAPDPSTVPFVRKALERNFDYLDYTGSDSDAIAKWFSWLLYAIGTQEAVDLMKEFSNSADEGIRKEMQYRLSKFSSEGGIGGE